MGWPQKIKQLHTAYRTEWSAYVGFFVLSKSATGLGHNLGQRDDSQSSF